MNIVIAAVGALLAAIPLLLAGYLFGVRRGVSARDGLRAELARREIEQAAQAQELKQARAALRQAEEKLAEKLATRGGTSSEEPLKEQIDSAMKNLLQPLLARDLQARELKEAVNGLLGPIVERERLGLELARLDPNLSGRGGLSQLLGTMATRAGFSTVLVTDNNGLPMGQNDGAKDVDMLCATLGLLLNMVDRITSSGSASPLAVVLRDSENQVALHRLFKVEGQRYVLTAVASGGLLTPDILDPTIARIERVLSSRS